MKNFSEPTKFDFSAWRRPNLEKRSDTCPLFFFALTPPIGVYYIFDIFFSTFKMKGYHFHFAKKPMFWDQVCLTAVNQTLTKGWPKSVKVPGTYTWKGLKAKWWKWTLADMTLARYWAHWGSVKRFGNASGGAQRSVYGSERGKLARPMATYGGLFYRGKGWNRLRQGSDCLLKPSGTLGGMFSRGFEWINATARLL